MQVNCFLKFTCFGSLSPVSLLSWDVGNDTYLREFRMDVVFPCRRGRPVSKTPGRPNRPALVGCHLFCCLCVSAFLCELRAGIVNNKLQPYDLTFMLLNAWNQSQFRDCLKTALTLKFYAMAIEKIIAMSYHGHSRGRTTQRNQSHHSRDADQVGEGFS